MDLVLIAIACGVVALLYGILTSQQVLRASPGNARMVEVAGAIPLIHAPEHIDEVMRRVAITQKEEPLLLQRPPGHGLAQYLLATPLAILEINPLDVAG